MSSTSTSYFIGLDLGQATDPSALAVLEQTRPAREDEDAYAVREAILCRPRAALLAAQHCLPHNRRRGGATGIDSTFAQLPAGYRRHGQ